MGYVKYREDDIEIMEHRWSMMERGDNVPYKREPIHYIDCKYCREIFTDRKTLYLHIKSKHNIVRPIVVINGKIATDRYVVNHIETAYIDLFGYSDIVSINGQELMYSPDDGTIDISQYLRQVLLSESICSIAFQMVTVEIEWAAISVDDVRLVGQAITQWESEVNEGLSLTTDFIDWADKGNRLFLQGMYNYYVACRAKKDKAKRYDDAWSILSRFNDIFGVGSCVLKTIAYRRNWVSSLQLLSDESVDDFSIASDYYQRNPSNLECPNTGKQLYVEDSIKMSLEFVRLFQMKKLSELKEKMAELTDLVFVDDLNFLDQLNLLNARLAVVDGDCKKAGSFYEKLVTPSFQEEYNMFKKGLVYFG